MAIDVHTKDGVAELVINNPPVNALDSAGWHEFAAKVKAVGGRDDIHCVVIRAEGRGFQAGVDIKELQADSTKITDVNRGCYDTFAAIYDCPVPVISAVHGYCIGAGVDLITACDIRYAAANTTFSIRETRLAMVADVGTLQRLPRIIDPGSVAELAYTGRDFDVGEAASLGLVGKVLSDADATLEAALETAELIAANSPLAVQGTKAVLRAGDGRTVDEALDYVSLWNATYLQSNDLGEALAAFVEKREPKFEGN